VKRTPEELARHRAYMKQWKERNPERIKELEHASRARRNADPVRLARYREYQKDYQKKLRIRDAVRHREKRQTRYYNDIDASRARGRDNARRVKVEVFARYGNQCACCGESNLVFLTIDHINGDGADHRRRDIKLRTGTSFYMWLRRNGYPKEFQILCYNCNCAKRTGDDCPHQRIRKAAVA
jgi:hypothetical protein